MTTSPTAYELTLTPAPLTSWGDPILDFFPEKVTPPQKARLYLAPSTFGEVFDKDEEPQPTSASELPDIRRWLSTYTMSVIEVLTGRRQPAQLIERTHRVIYQQLLRMIGTLKSVAKIRTLYLSQPLDGICEASITIAVDGRIRVIAIRCEGVDGRWLCTALRLI